MPKLFGEQERWGGKFNNFQFNKNKAPMAAFSHEKGRCHKRIQGVLTDTRANGVPSEVEI